MPDVIARAPSGRAKCRACSQKIGKDEHRFGEAVPNPFGDGETSHYYHLICAADRRPEKFKAALEGCAEEIPDKATLLATTELGIQHRRLDRAARAERASSGRARCRHCREAIEKGQLRIALEYIEDGMASAGGFIHVSCAEAYFGCVTLLSRLRRTSPKLDESDFAELAKTLN